MSTDPLAGIRSIADLDLPTLDDLELSQPYDDAPTFDTVTDPEVDTHKRLANDLTYVTRPRRLFHDYRSNPAAFRHIEQLPAEGDAHHLVISGKYAMFDLLPAIIERTGKTVVDLHIATLSYSKSNAADLLGMLNDGHVQRVHLLISYFFKAQNRQLYDSLVPELRARGHDVLAMRTHCKIFLVALDDGAKYIIHGSPNCRSSVNVEQLVFERHEGLYEFHRNWIEGELMHGVELGKDDETETT